MDNQLAQTNQMKAMMTQNSHVTGHVTISMKTCINSKNILINMTKRCQNRFSLSRKAKCRKCPVNLRIQTSIRHGTWSTKKMRICWRSIFRPKLSTRYICLALQMLKRGCSNLGPNSPRDTSKSVLMSLLLLKVRFKMVKAKSNHRWLNPKRSKTKKMKNTNDYNEVIKTSWMKLFKRLLHR